MITFATDKKVGEKMIYIAQQKRKFCVIEI